MRTVVATVHTLPEDVVSFLSSVCGLAAVVLDDRLDDANGSLESALSSKWGAVPNNATVINFALAKLYQQQEQHHKAISKFSEAIDIDPTNAWAYFRRAWSHKANNDFTAAGADFEQAKKLRWDDPNFSVDYKRIAKYAYMEIESEPDVAFVFPSLLPQPGLSKIT